MSNRDFKRCTVCGNLLGRLSDAVNACKKCGTPYEEMPEKEDVEVFK